ncbi:SDR family oxidoreductase [Providencia alcalifaciens]|uniref:SDR family oxidoreductase n=2 Tax=Providencia TaxID=586 RepID=A0AA42K3Q1_9GAMM|nr:MULTISPECIES: SDR family oxidoreductase [Providencia]EJD6409543.1 SDR family oxidoreductase [Providencia rettgeri]EJD6661840.1 SDR family oxidoreductase [Providencia rettgeri]ELR5173377.1 SDR family oxidoreductase [Providencia rettgeri]ELR5195956.1 SDR family oxidoreductase [Providencia rettgeri]ELU1436974.1 SDR family oxidoreductase [Providencia rettgeri]
MNINNNPRIIVVTGASQGIGYSICETYLRNGDIVIGCACESANKNINFLLENYTDSFYYHKIDVSKKNEIIYFSKIVNEKYGTIDVLVSNAGKNIFKGIDCEEEDWDHNFDLNLKSHWRMAKAFKPLLEKNNGVIIIITSNHAYNTLPECAPYNISKGALLSLVQSLMLNWGPTIRTVGIAPGFIDTEGNQMYFDSFSDPYKARQKIENKHSVKRIGKPEEVGKLCLFLSSNDAGFIAGTTILIDGGRSAVMQD